MEMENDKWKMENAKGGREGQRSEVGGQGKAGSGARGQAKKVKTGNRAWVERSKEGQPRAQKPII